MSILKYMKRHSSSSSNQLESSRDILPDPSGALSGKVPSEAIAAANKEVTKVLDKPCKESKSARGPYLASAEVYNWKTGSGIWPLNIILSIHGLVYEIYY